MLRMFFIILVLFAKVPASAATDIPRVLRVCGDEDEWAPFSYFLREDGKKTKTVAGFDISILSALLAESGRTATFTLLPWKRCLAEATAGAFDIAMDGIKVPEREANFLFPKSHYSLTSILIHRKDLPMPNLRDPDAWAAYKVCIQSGYVTTLSKYGRLAKVQMDLSPKSFEASIQMVLAGRCDGVLYSLEIVAANPKLGRLDILSDDRFSYMPLARGDMPKNKSEFYFMVSRSLPYREDLVLLLNRGIDDLKSSGRADQLLKAFTAP